MKLVNMKVTSETKTDMPVMPSANEYPYGLCLCLNNDIVKKLGLKEIPAVGAKMKIEAMVEVVRTSESDSKEMGEHKTLDLQITDLGLSANKGVNAKDFYGKKES